MLKRAYRLRKDRDFQRIYRKGQRRSTPNFTLYYQPSRFDSSQVGFVVSKKVSKSAVVRNSLRRRASAIVETHFKSIQKPFQIIVLIRKDYTSLTPSDLQQELHQLLKVVL